MRGIDTEKTPTAKALALKETPPPQTVAQFGELVRVWLAEAEQRVADRWNEVEKELNKRLDAIEKKLDGVPILIETLQITANDVMATRASQSDVALKQHDTVVRLEGIERRLNANGREGAR